MLYGHIETIEERVEHLLALRALQAETGGFQSFIPLAFHPDGNAMARLPAPTGVDDLRTLAVARLLLDNIPHVKAYWIMLGLKTAQTAQWFGADDLDGTVEEERIYHMAGAETPQRLGHRGHRAPHHPGRPRARSSATPCTTCSPKVPPCSPKRPIGDRSPSTARREHERRRCATAPAGPPAGCHAG